MKKIVSMALLAIMCGVGQVAKAQLPKLKDTPITAKFGGYVVGDYSYYTDEDMNKTAGFNLRYARVYVNGTVAKDFKYRLQAEMAGAPGVDKGPRVIDAYTEWVKYSWLNVRFGQMKRVFTFENPYNPWTVGFGSNAQVISKLAGMNDRCGEHASGGRDLGLVLQGDLLPVGNDEHNLLHYQVGVYNGQGINHKDANENKDIIGGLWLSPFKNLQIGAFGWKGEYVGTTADKKTVTVDRNRMAFGVKYEADWTARAEYITSKGKSVSNANWGDEADGWYAAVGVPVGDQFKIYGKWDVYRNEKTSDTQKSIYGLSLNYWLDKNLLFQAGYSYIDDRSVSYGADGVRIANPDKNYSMLQMQVYVRF